MTNWKEIHEDFAKYLHGIADNGTHQQKWAERSLTYQDAQEWIAIGFEPKDYEEVKQWKNFAFIPYQAKVWIDIGLNKNDAKFVIYLKGKGYQPNPGLKIGKLKEEFDTLGKTAIAQEYLDAIFPKNQRKEITGLNFHQKNLIGSLDLSDFDNLEELYCGGNKLTSLNLSKCSKLEKIYCFDNQLTDLILPKNASNLKALYLSNNEFNQDLSFLKEAINLEKLFLANNKFHGSLEPLKEMGKLELLNISDTDIDGGVEYLPDNLSDSSKISYSRKKRPQSKVKEIETQLNFFTDKAGQKFWAERGFTLKQALKRINDEAKYGLCNECKQPNTGEQWCKECNSQYLKMHFKNWTSGNQVIDECIQKYQLEATDKDKFLEWIPYEQFADIEYLAKGGFGKVYKAKWPAGIGDNPIVKWNKDKNRVIKNVAGSKENYGKIISRDVVEKIINNGDALYSSVITIDDKGGYSVSWGDVVTGSAEYKHYSKERIVVLKSLNDSQNVTADFLQEVTNHKKVESEMIISCYGISQDPQTKNFFMIMDYVKDDNLRKYLQNNYDRLDLNNKVKQLFRIAQALWQIHKQGLIHRDFHSGNILSGHDGLYVTDLGLCKSASETSQEDKIFGVMPYVAPEVLRGQPYTPASDIYSFGIVAYEWLTNSYPYADSNLDGMDLALRVCTGLRPDIDKLEIPHEFKELIKSCWDANPGQRPSAEKLSSKLLFFIENWQEEANKYNYSSLNTPYKINPETVTHSKLINTKQITELVQQCQSSRDLELDLDLDINFDELTIQEESKELSNQERAQILQTNPPKPGNNN